MLLLLLPSSFVAAFGLLYNCYCCYFCIELSLVVVVSEESFCEWIINRMETINYTSTCTFKCLPFVDCCSIIILYCCVVAVGHCCCGCSCFIIIAVTDVVVVLNFSSERLYERTINRMKTSPCSCCSLTIA